MLTVYTRIFWKSLIIVLTFVQPVWYLLDGLEFESQSEESFFFSSKSYSPTLGVCDSFHLKPKLRLSGALPLLPLCAFMPVRDKFSSYVTSHYWVCENDYWAFSLKSSLLVFDTHLLQVPRNSIPMDKHKYSGSPVGIPTPVVVVQWGMQYQIVRLSAFEFPRKAFKLESCLSAVSSRYWWTGLLRIFQVKVR